jgi:hypothetical protein
MIAKRIVMPPIRFIISPFNSKDVCHVIDRDFGRPPIGGFKL